MTFDEFFRCIRSLGFHYYTATIIPLYCNEKAKSMFVLRCLCPYIDNSLDWYKDERCEPESGKRTSRRA